MGEEALVVWVRIDDDFSEHPKVAAAGPLAMAMQVAGLAYCNRNLTDGFIPAAKARGLISWESPGLREGSPPLQIAVTWSGELVGGGEDVESRYVISLLLDAGMWEEVPGGYRIHDYDHYQPTRAQVEAERQQKRSAGQAGGQASARARARARAEAPAQAEPQAESNPVPVPVPVPQKAAFESDPENLDWSYIDSDHIYLLRKLRAIDESWAAVTPIVDSSISNTLGGPAVTLALRHAYEERLVPDSPIAWLRAAAEASA